MGPPSEEPQDPKIDLRPQEKTCKWLQRSYLDHFQSQDYQNASWCHFAVTFVQVYKIANLDIRADIHGSESSVLGRVTKTIFALSGHHWGQYGALLSTQPIQIPGHYLGHAKKPP